MRTKIFRYRDPYVRGPHVRYFVTAIIIAFGMTAILLAGFILFVRLVFPLD